MGRAKEIGIKVIPAKIANEFVKKHHYSGKVVQNSSIHFGAFLDGRMHGVMSFGSPLDKRKVLGLVSGTKWNEMLELNRMAFNDYLPPNSESRCISVAIRLIKKHAPHIKWILSFADGTQCGDGAIYRASGFYLTGLKKNTQTVLMPGGEVESRLSLTNTASPQKRTEVARRYNIELSSRSSLIPFLNAGAKILVGYQLRYIYLIDKKSKITVPILPFSAIDEAGARMYKGKKLNAALAQGSAPGNQSGGGVRSDHAAQNK